MTRSTLAIAARSRRAFAQSSTRLDARGAWVEEGAIGKSNRLVSVLAGRDLVVMLGGKPLTMKENETLEVFAGPEAPRQRIIRSSTFAQNVGLLSGYLAARQDRH